MMDKNLLKALEPIETEFDVFLMTDEDALEFVKADKESINETINREIEIAKTCNKDMASGMEYVLQFINSFLQNRIDEGY